VPFSGAWCDKHYRRIFLFDPRGTVGFLLWAAIVSIVICLAVLFWKNR
jgi:hypothetical protein